MKILLFSMIFITVSLARAFDFNPNENLVAFFPFDGNFSDSIQNHGVSFSTDRFGKENSALYFDGDSSYLEIPDNDAFSINTTGALTISVWVSPEVLNFKLAEKGGYIHWMGKGIPKEHEWTFRMYNKDLTSEQENRPNRMSAYAFNLEGGLGSGSYVQEPLEPNEWIHFVARYDISSNSITLFKNGEKKDQDDLYDTTYGVQVQNGNAPVRLGTRSLWSFFQGRIDDLRFYNKALTDDEIQALYLKEVSIETEETPSSITSKKTFPQKNNSLLCKNKRVPCLIKNDKAYDLKGRKSP